MPSGHEVWLQVQSTKEIRHVLKQAWSFFVFQQVQHRKGATLQPFDFFTQHKAVQKTIGCFPPFGGVKILQGAFRQEPLKLFGMLQPLCRALFVVK